MNLLQHLRMNKQSSPSQKNNIQTTRLLPVKQITHKRETSVNRTEIRKSSSPKSFDRCARYDSLPPIYELKKSKILDLQRKQSEVIQNLLLSKHQVSPIRSRSHRNKTQMAGYSKKYMLSHRSSMQINFQQTRMKPVDKYYKRLDNIRMAERLLTIKASPCLKRDSLKKFYLQQKNYRSQICKNSQFLKAKRSRKGSRVVKEWIL